MSIKNYERKNLDIDFINENAKINLNKLIKESEIYYIDQVNEIIKEITNPNKKIKIILISGPSSAGKTTTSSLIRLGLSKKNINSIVISLDNFYINRKDTPKFLDGSYDFENINTLDLSYINKFIDKLLKNHKAKMPIFNFVTGEREKRHVDVEIDNNTMIIIEGLHAFNPNLIKNHESELYKVYLSLNANYVKNNDLLLPAKQIRLLRRITRDFYTRGYSVLETLSSWKNVCEGEDIWIKPFKNTANYIIDSVHQYELLLYARYTKPIIKELILEKNVKSMLENESAFDKKQLLLNRLCLAKDLYKVLHFAYPIDKKNVPKTSLLSEFIGNAKDTVEPSGKIFK